MCMDLSLITRDLTSHPGIIDLKVTEDLISGHRIGSSGIDRLP